MKFRVIALPLALTVTACGSSNGSGAPVERASGTSVPASASSQEAAPTPDLSANVKAQPVQASAESQTVSFNCISIKKPGGEMVIAISNWVVGGDHMGPQASYNVTSGDELNEAAGAVRLFNATGEEHGDEYEFLDGKLGQLHAKIVPSSQGFYAILVGQSGTECSKEGSDV